MHNVEYKRASEKTGLRQLPIVSTGFNAYLTARLFDVMIVSNKIAGSKKQIPVFDRGPCFIWANSLMFKGSRHYWVVVKD